LVDTRGGCSHSRVADTEKGTAVWLAHAVRFGLDWTRAYLHLSRLALHTHHLLTDPHVSLFIAEPDRPRKNPLALRRLNLQGEAAVLTSDAPSYGEITERYLSRFPQAEMMFGFGDFAIWELRLEDAHFVLGFGQSFVSTAATPSRWVHQKVERPSSRKD
jgi:heme iron utilization protein